MSFESANSPIDRVLQILTSVAYAGHPLKVHEIAEEVKQPTSTVYRHIASLKKWGFLQEVRNSKALIPGPIGVKLAWGDFTIFQLIEKSGGALLELAKLSRESVGVFTFWNGDFISVALEESDECLRCTFPKKSRDLLHEDISARCLLAFIPGDQKDEITTDWNKKYSIDLLKLEKQLESIRAKGYAVSEHDSWDGIWEVSFPLSTTSDGKANGVITLAAPACRAAGRGADLIQMTRNSAWAICRNFDVE
jgi:DNA-binding IclR family transcriptional regulator